MIERAIKQAKKSTDFRVRIGCVLTDKKGRIIGAGYNKKKSHPYQHRLCQEHNQNKIFLHAEIDALIRKEGDVHTVYVARIKKDGSLGKAKPCEICAAAIKESGAQRLVFTDDDGDIVEMGL